MARRSPIARRGRASVNLTSAIAGVILSLTLAAFATSGLAGASSPGADADRVIVCESGVVQHEGGVETSSAVAFRASDGQGDPELGAAPGCRDG